MKLKNVSVVSISKLLVPFVNKIASFWYPLDTFCLQSWVFLKLRQLPSWCWVFHQLEQLVLSLAQGEIEYPKYTVVARQVIAFGPKISLIITTSILLWYHKIRCPLQFTYNLTCPQPNPHDCLWLHFDRWPYHRDLPLLLRRLLFEQNRLELLHYHPTLWQRSSSPSPQAGKVFPSGLRGHGSEHPTPPLFLGGLFFAAAADTGK